MPSLFAPIDIEADLESLRFSAPTAHLAYHDTEIERFVERAIAQKLPPSVFELPAWVFPYFVPEVLHSAPMWLHWLGDGYDDVIDELAHVRVAAADHYSTDLLHRREMLAFNTTSHAFCTSARGLVSSLHCACDNEVLSLFVSPTRFVCNPTWVSDDLLLDLNTQAHYSGTQYRPHDQFSREELSAALVRSVLLGNEPKVDDEGREIVLLKKRALPQDWFD